MFKRRRRDVPLVSLRIAHNTKVPKIVAVPWADSRTVIYLATELSTRATTVIRRSKLGRVDEVPRLSLVRVHNESVGGVDEHDALRLHQYFIQKPLRHISYYTSIYFSIINMTLVNTFIVHRLNEVEQDTKTPTLPSIA